MKSRPLRLARRTGPFQESVIREMTRLGDETGSVNLSQGLPEFDPPPQVLEAAVQAIQDGENQYTFPFGLPAFREAIASKAARDNKIRVEAETGITVTCGVSEAMLSAILALSDPGDEAVILEPWYENYLPDCLMAGVHPRFVPLQEPDYSFDPDELRSAFNKRTRLILVNTPHNPTGRVFNRDELEVISQLCQEFGVIAITDEIYEHILYGGNTHLSLGSLDGMQDRTVTISGLGKSYALTGWRVGWALADPQLSKRIRKVHDYLTICAPSPFQAAGIVALGLPDSYYEDLRARYSHCKEILLNALQVAGFSFHQPEGAYYVMADFSALAWERGRFSLPDGTEDRAFAKFMAHRIGVAVVPGSSFYNGAAQGNTRVRFNFAKLEPTLHEAARRLEKLG